MLPGCMSLHGTLFLTSWLDFLPLLFSPPPDRLLAAPANRIIIATQSYDPPVLVHCVPVLFSILHRRNHLSQISSFFPPWLASLFWKGFSSRIRKANKKIYTAFLPPSPTPCLMAKIFLPASVSVSLCPVPVCPGLCRKCKSGNARYLWHWKTKRERGVEGKSLYLPSQAWSPSFGPPNKIQIL